jgi:hypothetical protein
VRAQSAVMSSGLDGIQERDSKVEDGLTMG